MSMVIGIQPDKSTIPPKYAFVLLILPDDEVHRLTPLMECEELFEYAYRECPGIIQEWELDGGGGDCRERADIP